MTTKPIISMILFGLLGFMLAVNGVSITDKTVEFIAILAIAAGIELNARFDR